MLTIEGVMERTDRRPTLVDWTMGPELVDLDTAAFLLGWTVQDVCAAVDAGAVDVVEGNLVDKRSLRELQDVVCEL